MPILFLNYLCCVRDGGFDIFCKRIPRMVKKQREVKQKSVKEIRKELEEKAFGLKDKKQKAAIQKQLESLNMKERIEKKKEERVTMEKNAKIKQLIPVGTDPKTVQCVNFMNNVCSEGELCRFSHKIIKEQAKQKDTTSARVERRICQFLIDAVNSRMYNDEWRCPLTKCNKVHKLVDIEGDTEVRLTLEEYIELSRQSLPRNLTPLTEERFVQWKLRKQNEEKEHTRNVQKLTNGMKGTELFKTQQELFEDDDDVMEFDYKERCDFESEETN